MMFVYHHEWIRDLAQQATTKSVYHYREYICIWLHCICDLICVTWIHCIRLYLWYKLYPIFRCNIRTFWFTRKQNNRKILQTQKHYLKHYFYVPVSSLSAARILLFKNIRLEFEKKNQILNYSLIESANNATASTA